MKSTRTARLVVATLVVLGLAGPASAQTQVFGLNIEGDVEVGVRLYGDKPSKSESAKFEEYRDLVPGPFLDQFRLRLFRPDESYSVEIEGSKWNQEDQEFSVRAGRLGLWEFEFDWDQTPHIFSTNARFLYDEPKRGVFTLPTPRPAVNATNYNGAPELDQISVRWDTARMLFRLTPTPDLELKAEYTRINKEGNRPIGVAFGFNFVEVLEPIEQTVHDFRLQGTWARERWQLQFSYALSLFENAVDRLRVDNPFFRAAPTPQAGQLSLPPDNQAHTFSLAGGLNLPWWRTRLTGNISYSLRLQNDDFLPHTINAALAAPPLPQDSLNGLVHVVLFNANATSRPLPPLTLSAKYRLYDLNDDSDVITFVGHVETDTTVEDEARRVGRFSYLKQNGDLDARWQIFRPVAVTIGGAWERWDRNEHREVRDSDELFAKAVLDVTPLDWLLFRAKYMPSFRRIDRYNTRAHANHTVVEEPETAPQGQSLLLRKLDEAERDRHRVDVLLQLTPLDTLTTTLTGGWRADDYIASTLGLQDETNWSAGIDVSWNPIDRFSAFAGYVYEQNFQRQRSRSRPVVTTVTAQCPVPPCTFDYLDFDWLSINTDTVNTYHAGVKATLIPKVLDWTANWNFSTALGRIETRNPVAPTSGTAAQNATARAKPMPAFEDALHRVETALKYYFWKNWSAKLAYIFESFEKTDWRTDTLDPFVPGAATATSGGIWLGNDLKDYTAHIVAVTLGYRFR